MSEINYVVENDDSFSESVERNHFGKLKVLVNNRLCPVTIGPDCTTLHT